ncbi:subtilisin-like protein, partial [Aureobasidium melanogenum]
MHFWAPFALFAGVSGLLLDKVDHVPQGWSEIESPSPSTRFKLSIALIPANKELLHKTLTNISTPGHEDYGKYLNESELQTVVRPSETSTNAVLKFLEDSGIPRSDFEQHGDWIDFTTDAKTANKMMDASFKTYREDTGRDIVIVRTKEYSLPEEVARHVNMIEPTTQFPTVARPLEPRSVHIDQALQKPIDQNDCSQTITPECLRNLYNLPPLTFLANASKHGFIGVAGFLEQYPQSEDFDLFAKSFAPYLIDKPTFIPIDGQKNLSARFGSGIEANLDVQYAAAMGYPLPVTYYSTHGLFGRADGPNRAIAFGLEDFLVLARYLREQPKELLPHTLSVSYGRPEPRMPDAYMRKTCDMFAELGARGVTVLFASGDNSLEKICRLDNKRFVPVFPASCPYVTSVGGTNFVNPEAPASDSTGGFSEFFPRPDWQANAVESYLDTLGTRWSGLYNSSGRGFPDIAAQMERYLIYNGMLPMAISGTSASAPAVAGIVGLVNSALVDAGKSPLGFMNPFLYSVGHKAFRDIVNGSSKGCGEELSSTGWDAAEGWDPVTGFRTPEFSKLLSIAMQQQA